MAGNRFLSHVPKEPSSVDPYGADIAPPQVKPEPAVQA
jgi:hypothetical protein